MQNIYRIAAICAAAVPALWLGLLLIMLLAGGTGVIGVFPASGFLMTAGLPLKQSELDTACCKRIGYYRCISYAVYTFRLLMLHGQIISPCSMAAGMTRRVALWKTGLRLEQPQLASAGIIFAGMVSRVSSLEQLFVLPGLSGMLMRDIQNRDFWQRRARSCSFGPVLPSCRKAKP